VETTNTVGLYYYYYTCIILQYTDLPRNDYIMTNANKYSVGTYYNLQAPGISFGLLFYKLRINDITRYAVRGAGAQSSWRTCYNEVFIGGGGLKLKKTTVPITAYIIEYSVFLLLFFTQRRVFFVFAQINHFFVELFVVCILIIITK